MQQLLAFVKRCVKFGHPKRRRRAKIWGTGKAKWAGGEERRKNSEMRHGKIRKDILAPKDSRPIVVRP
jgi:hypothetical protein